MTDRVKALIFIVTLVFIAGCAPSNSVCKSAVTESLMQQGVPSSIIAENRFGNGSNVVLQDLRIIKTEDARGNASSDSYIVTVYMEGTCEVALAGVKKFKGEVEYFLIKNGGGKWEASARSL